jgi:hypothetical protein
VLHFFNHSCAIGLLSPPYSETWYLMTSCK